MCTSRTLVLENLNDAQQEIRSALARGSVRCALGTIQCLWIFCSDADELHELLDDVLVAAGSFRHQLTDADAWELTQGIAQAKADYLENLGYTSTKECLLAATAA